MKLLAFLLLAVSITATAGTTCPKTTKVEYICKSAEHSQYDFCKKKNSQYQIRINGEVYSQNAEKSNFDGLTQFQGTNYVKTRFIVEFGKNKRASLTEVNQYEIPVGNPVELSCSKQK